MGELEDHDPVPLELAALAECRQNSPRVEGQELAESIAGRSQGTSIACGIPDQEDDPSGIVANLQGQLPLQGLKVDELGLGLDTNAPRLLAPVADDSVPGAEIAFDWEGNLDLPAQVRMKPGSEPLEERDVGSIADRISGRIGLEAELESNDREPGSNIRNDDALQLAVLKSPELRHRGARSAGHIPQAQSGTKPRLPELTSEARKAGPGAA